MKNLLITTMLFLSMGMFAQTHARKTRSDKGKTHSHIKIKIPKTCII